MLRAVGLDLHFHRDIVLEAWLYKEADVRGQVDMHTEAKGGRELPRCSDDSLLAGLILTIHIEV